MHSEGNVVSLVDENNRRLIFQDVAAKLNECKGQK